MVLLVRIGFLPIVILGLTSVALGLRSLLALSFRRVVGSESAPVVEARSSPTLFVGGDSDRLRYWGLLIYGATLGVRTPCGLAFEDKRAEGRAIVRVYILDPAALATSSQALCVFLAVWRRWGGKRYSILPVILLRSTRAN